MNIRKLQTKELITQHKEIETKLESFESDLFTLSKIRGVQFLPAKIYICNLCIRKLNKYTFRKWEHVGGHYLPGQSTIILSTSATLFTYLHEMYHHFQYLRGGIVTFICNPLTHIERRSYEIEANEFARRVTSQLKRMERIY